MNRTIRLTENTSAALVGALIGYSLFYQAQAADEQIAVIADDHRAAAANGERLAGELSVTGKHALDKGDAATLERAVRMGLARLQLIVGDRREPAVRRAEARMQQLFLIRVFNELRPDLAHQGATP